MTTSIYKQLEPYRQKLLLAKQIRYARFSTTEQEMFFACYKDTFNEELTRAQKACPHCCLKAMIRLVEEMERFEKTPAYHKYKKEQENGEEKTNPDSQ